MSKIGKIVALFGLLLVSIGKNADVLFRGCAKNVDSFAGASKGMLRHSDGLLTSSGGFTKSNSFKNWKYAPSELVEEVTTGSKRAAYETKIKHFLSDKKVKDKAKDLLEEVIDLNEEDLNNEETLTNMILQYAQANYIKLYKPDLIINSLESDRSRGIFYTRKMNRCKTSIHQVNGLPMVFADIVNNFSTPNKYRTQIDSLIQVFKDTPLKKSDVFIISLLNKDAGAMISLKSRFKKQHLTIKNANNSTLMEEIRTPTNHKKLVIVLAELEKNQLLLQSEHDVQRFAFEEIIQENEKLGLNLFLLGCKSSLKGQLKDVLLPYVAINQLTQAVNYSHNMLDLLASMAKNGLKVVFKPHSCGVSGVLGRGNTPYTIINNQK